MKFVEFLVFICRISYEHYRGTPYENEMMHLKIEHTLPLYCNVINAVPQFLFNEAFEYKPTVKKAKKAKVVIVKKKDSSDSGSGSETPKEEEEEEEDTSSEDDLGEVVVLEDGKFKLSQVYIDNLAKNKLEKAERRRVREENRAKKLEEKAAKEAERQAKLALQQKNKTKFVMIASSEEDEDDLDQLD